MIVSTSARSATGLAALLLLALLPPLLVLSSVASAAAPRPSEPKPPRPGARADPALLHRSGTQVRLPPGAAPPPALSARSWLVADAGTGDVLAARDAHRPLAPASTLKTLFALTVLPRLSQNARHTVSERELTGLGAGSSLVGVKEDVTYRVADLWRGVFLHSGNDAVRVLAGLNGGWEATARQMEATARSLGALDTKVVSPDGYDAPGQVSSAYDLALFGREGLRNPDFARYCALPYAMFPAGGWSYGIRNTNRLLTGDDGVARYPGLLGVKNGYTSRAGHTLIAAARRDGRTLVVTVMDPRSGGGNAVYEEARQLLDWGFGPGAKARPVGSLLPPATARPVPFVKPKAPAGPTAGAVAAGRTPGEAPGGARASAPAPASPSAPASASVPGSAAVAAPVSGGAPAAGPGAPSPSSARASARSAAPPAVVSEAPGPATVRAAAAGGVPSPGSLMPAVLVGAACAAAAALWAVRRAAR